MNFDLWCNEKKLSNKAVAEALQIGGSHCSLIRRGRARPSLSLLAKIEDLTHDLVRPRDFLRAWEDYQRSKGR